MSLALIFVFGKISFFKYRLRQKIFWHKYITCIKYPVNINLIYSKHLTFDTNELIKNVYYYNAEPDIKA